MGALSKNINCLGVLTRMLGKTRGKQIMYLSRNTGLFINALLLLLLVSAPASSKASDYTIIDLGPVSVTGINNNGYVTGSYNGQAFVFDGTNKTWLDKINSGDTYALDINNNGFMTGFYYAPGSTVDSSIAYHDGQSWYPLGKFGAEFAWSKAINDNGLIAGTYKPSGSGNRAFIYDISTESLVNISGPDYYSDSSDINNSGHVAGMMKGLDGYDRAYFYDGVNVIQIGTLGGLSRYGDATLGAFRSWALGINDNNIVVGASHDSNYRYHAFKYDGANLIDLGTLGGLTSTANQVNNNGVIVGNSEAPDGLSYAFIHDGVTMRNLNDLALNAENWVLTDASDINDTGMIIGKGTLNGAAHAFLLKPVVHVDLSLQGSGPTLVNVGESVLYSYGVENLSSVDAPNASLIVVLASGMQVDQVTTDKGTCSVVNTEVICALGVIPANGGSANVALSVYSVEPGNTTLTAEVSSDGTELNAQDNSAAINITVNSVPQLLMSSPAPLYQFYQETDLLLFDASANDLEDGDLTASINWFSDIDGQIGLGGNYVRTLSPGIHTITARVTDSVGVSASDIGYYVVNAVPEITLLSPTNGSVFWADDLVTLQATATDLEDGDLNARIYWGGIGEPRTGYGPTFEVYLPIGLNTITASVEDSAHGQKAVSIDVTVNAIPPINLSIGSITGRGANKTVTLSWSGARSEIAIYKDGSVISTGTATGTGTYSFKKEANFHVCEIAKVNCSNSVYAN